MTLNDLKKKISLVEEASAQQCRVLERLHNKPFCIWDVEEHKQEDIGTRGDCCFNHIIGLPTKGMAEKPLFDYQKMLYDALLDNNYSNILHHSFKHKHL